MGTEQPRGQIVGAGDVPAHRTRMVHLHRGDGVARHMSREAAADHFNLGKLRHPNYRESAPDAGDGSASSVVQACAAASVSADFFDRPSPRPYTSPLT